MAGSSNVRREAWRRPRRARVRAIRDRLRELYGRPVNHPHGHPIAELVRTILSQNTNDRNRDLAYGRLRERLPGWDEVRDAPASAVAEAIQPGGLAETKAPRIQEALRRLPTVEPGASRKAAQQRRDSADASQAARLGSASRGEPTLDWLAEADRDQAIEFLVGLPGVGRKTAACVMIFALGRPEIPVDTHVYRVGGRLGLFRANASFDSAHDEMLAVTDAEDAYELHMNLIAHGRRVCRPRPRCGECALRRMCPYYREHRPSQ